MDDNVVESSFGSGEPILIYVSAAVTVDDFEDIERAADQSRVAYRIKTVSPTFFEVNQLSG